MALDRVGRGQQITQAHMDELALEARRKVGTRPYVFHSPVVWQVPNRTELLKFHLADYGVNPGGIVIVKDERKVYRLRPGFITQAGKKNWEIFENWQELSGWWVVDGLNAGNLSVPPYHNNLQTLTNAAVGDIGVVIAPWPRSSLNFPPIGSIIQPTLYQLWRGSSSDLGNWRDMGGTQEFGHSGLALDPSGGLRANTTKFGAPRWRNEMRTIAKDALAKISNASGQPWRSYVYGQRQFSYVGNGSGLPPGHPLAATRRLFADRAGADLELDPSLHLPTFNRVRMYKNIDYYARGESEVEVEVTVSTPQGLPIPEGNWLSPPYGSPAGVDFNFRILNQDFSPTRERRLWGWVESSGGGQWTDSTGVGRIPTPFEFRNMLAWGNPDFPLTSTFDVPWNGGSFRVSAMPSVASNISYHQIWRLRVPVVERVSRSGHPTSLIYRARMPEVAVEVNGWPTPIGSKPEIQSVIYRPTSGDISGAWVATPMATAPWFDTSLKWPQGNFNTPGFWTLEPYPVLRRPNVGGIPVPTPAQKWADGVNEPGNAVLYDVCATRQSVISRGLNYAGTQQMIVQIGIRQGTVFQRLFDVIIPAGQGVGHADPSVLRDVVIMDNEPLYFAAPTGTVSMVQAMAFKRLPSLGGSLITGDGIVGPFDYQGAQMGFSESYNEVVDLLESL